MHRRRRVPCRRQGDRRVGRVNIRDITHLGNRAPRDLHRGSDQPEQSYSERQIYQAALERLARELAAVEKIDQVKATLKLENVLTKEREKKAA